MTGRAWVTALAALAGLAVAIALAFVASDLTTQQVGLGAEDPGAGARLAPAPTTPARATPTRPRTLPVTTIAVGGGRGGDEEVHEPPDADD